MNPTPPSALEHIQTLSETIGGRGSCSPKSRLAAEYCLDQMNRLGAQQARIESLPGSPSTYRPYALAFGAVLLGTLWVWLIGGRSSLAAAALLHLLAAWGMYAETDFTNNWMRWLLPTRAGYNAVGVIPPAGETRRRVVLCAHIDSHRTPVFYSTDGWVSLFRLLIAAAFASLVLGALTYGAAAIFNWPEAKWAGLALAPVQGFILLLCLQADLTPLSPGANDNASGVGVTLELAQRMAAEPLQTTEVWLAFTDAEEAAAYGMQNFLKRHTAELGRDAVFIILDQVGIGKLTYVVDDGLIRKYPTHPAALELAARASQALPEIEVKSLPGLAYTDALLATRRGLVALTIAFVPEAGINAHWHQRSDTHEHIETSALEDARRFTWEILQQIDQNA